MEWEPIEGELIEEMPVEEVSVGEVPAEEAPVEEVVEEIHNEEPDDEDPEVDAHEDETPDEYDLNEIDDVKYTPSEDSDLGYWQGERGDSLFIPSNPEAQRILEECGLEGIPYIDGVPDFSRVCIATIYLSQEDMERMGDAKQK